MRGIIKAILIYSITFVTLISCVEEQDFGQYDEVELTPAYEASLLYVEAPESLVNDAPTNVVFSQNFNFDAFSSDVFVDRVIDGTITYIVENTTSKEMTVTVELLDGDGNVLDTEVFPIEPAPTAQLQREVAYGNSGKNINIIKNTSSLRVSTINLGDNTGTSDLPDPKIILKSSGKFRVRIK